MIRQDRKERIKRNANNRLEMLMMEWQSRERNNFVQKCFIRVVSCCYSTSRLCLSKQVCCFNSVHHYCTSCSFHRFVRRANCFMSQKKTDSSETKKSQVERYVELAKRVPSKFISFLVLATISLGSLFPLTLKLQGRLLGLGFQESNFLYFDSASGLVS
jgi:hypothetical protein